MNSDTRAGLGANESVFRQINEAIERGQWPGDEPERVTFRCECAQLGCAQLLELTVADYERVRVHPRRFLIAQGHVQPEVERVIERFDTYWVVEKRGQAGDVAEAADPRR